MANVVPIKGRRRGKSTPKNRPVRQRKQRLLDYNLLAVVIILVCFGLVMLYSASAYEAANSMQSVKIPVLNFVVSSDMYYFFRQSVISVAALIIALVISNMDYHFFVGSSTIIYWAGFILMAMVRFTPFGVTINGARRWLKLGVQFQPSEIAKIGIILCMSYMIVEVGKSLKTRKITLNLIGAAALQAAGALVLTDNLSTAIIIFGIGVGMIYIAHPRKNIFIAVALGGIIFVIGVVLFIDTFMRNSTNFRVIRILALLHKEEYASSEGYQVMQGLYAIGRGGFLGQGLGNSTQKLSTIPEAQNDMIFAIICEELGLFGALIVIILFGYLLYRLFIIAQNAPDLYGSLVVSGIFIHIALQVILNICVVLYIIPTTGVTLPFVSYGGTSVLFLMFEIGLALGVSRQIPTE